MIYKPAVLPPNETLTPDAEAFCRAHGLAPHLAQIQSLAQKHFPDAAPVTFRLEADPDYDGECLEVAITAPADLSLASTLYDRFTDEWVAKAPDAVREKIRFAYKVR
jgi:hypothetical protein